MLMKYLCCVILLMESKLSYSLADIEFERNGHKSWNYFQTDYTDPLNIPDHINCSLLQTRPHSLNITSGSSTCESFRNDDNSCCDYSKSSSSIFVCVNLRNVTSSVLNCSTKLILIHSNVIMQSTQNVEKLVIVNSNVTLRDVEGCHGCKRDANRTSHSRITTLEVYYSNFCYEGRIHLPDLINLTIYNSSISVQLLDLSWTTDSRRLRNITVINSKKLDTPLTPPVSECVAKTYLPYKSPEMLEVVSLRGTDFHCSYISTARSQWFPSLKGVIDEPDKNCSAEYLGAAYFRISEVSEAFNSMTKDCPSECCCRHSQMTYKSGKFFYTVDMDCSNQNLTEIPTKRVPKFVTDLNVSHNKIKSLSNIKSNFKDLLQLNADFNDLESVRGLEESEFAKQFQKISLRSNKITIDDHLMQLVSNRQSEKYGSQILISNNTVGECRCEMTEKIQPWLSKFSIGMIGDFDRIYCLNNTADGTKYVHLLVLYKESICRQPEEEENNFWQYVIITESSLMTMLLTKFGYDFWMYKRTSQLPWIALKLL